MIEENEQENEGETTDMRGDIESAFGDDYKEETPTETNEATTDDIPTQEAETGGANEETVGAESPGEAPAPTESLAQGKSHKAPIDWLPQEREQWSKIPSNLQQKILNREKDIAATMQGTKQARQTSDQFNQLAQNYASVLAAEGVNDPMAAVESYFGTVATLQNGSQQQKAQMVAQMVQHYGIDINTLDSALVGENNPQMQQQDQMQRMIDQRMQPYDQMMQQNQQQEQYQQQQQTEQANTEVRAFADRAEFLPDVRNDMADLIDMAAQQGRTMDLPEAYRKACSLNPQIMQILTERQRNGQLQQNSASLAAKKAAASSLNGRMSGTGGANSGDMSMHDSIASAWNSQMEG